MNYVLELFLSPGARNVVSTIGNLKEILKKLPAGTHRVILLDVAAEPEAAERAGVVATPTLIPLLRIDATGAIPEASLPLEPGQWATATPWAAKIPMSSSDSQTQ